MVLILYMMEISPPCRAVLMTIKQLGLQVELREQNLVVGNPKRHTDFVKIGLQVELREQNLVVGNSKRDTDFVKINPRSCVPTIDDDGFYLWESRAIMTYLVNKYAPNNSLYPKDPKKRALVDMMLNFDQGTLYRSQVDYLYPVIFRGEQLDSTKEASYKSALSMLEKSLERSAFVAGKYLTLADLSIVASISLAEAYDYNFRPYPHTVEWLRRLKRELSYYREVNEIPLLQFKFWYKPFIDSDEEDSVRTGATHKTRL